MPKKKAKGVERLPAVDTDLRIFIDKELKKLSKKVAALTKDLNGLHLRLFQQQKYTELKVPKSKKARTTKQIDPQNPKR